MRCGSCAIADEAGPVCIGLFAGCLSEFFATVGIAAAIRAPGLFRLATGGWLMYLTSAVTVDFALGYHRLTWSWSRAQPRSAGITMQGGFAAGSGRSPRCPAARRLSDVAAASVGHRLQEARSSGRHRRLHSAAHVRQRHG